MRFFIVSLFATLAFCNAQDACIDFNSLEVESCTFKNIKLALKIAIKETTCPGKNWNWKKEIFALTESKSDTIDKAIKKKIKRMCNERTPPPVEAPVQPPTEGLDKCLVVKSYVQYENRRQTGQVKATCSCVNKDGTPLELANLGDEECSGLISSVSVLSSSSGFFFDTLTQEVSVPNGSILSSTTIEEEGGGVGKLGRRRRRRRRLETSGDKKVLIIRADSLDSSTSSDEDTLREEILGIGGNDEVNGASQYAACSYGKLMLSASNLGNNGVYSAALTNTIIGSSNSAIRNAMHHETQENLGSLESAINAGDLDLVILCIPPGTVGNWIAYAYINYYISVYNDKWCEYPSSIMHELGHNFRLAHSGENNNEYGDQSGMMGYSYGQDEGPKMCFNGPHTYQLGWFPEFSQQVESSDSFYWQGHLIGFNNKNDAELCEAEDENCDTMIFRLTPKTGDECYVHFNRKDGFNSGSREGNNKVLVATTERGLGYRQSWLQAKMSANSQYTISNFGDLGDLIIDVGAIITNSGGSSWADVSITYGAIQTDSPVVSILPSDAPVIAPTDVSTSSPVPEDNVPTGAPVPEDDPETDPPIVSTDIPSVSPSNSPSVAPTATATENERVETYSFPKTETSQFVHGICVHSDKSTSASSTYNELQYKVIENVQSGVIVWDDRSYTLAGVEDSPCAGATYLQPSRHKSISRNTEIIVEVIFEEDPTAEICMFVEEGRGRDGGFSDSLREYDSRIVDHGANTGLAWRRGGNDHPFRVFCRTVPDQPTAAPTPEPTLPPNVIVDTCINWGSGLEVDSCTYDEVRETVEDNLGNNCPHNALREFELFFRVSGEDSVKEALDAMCANGWDNADKSTFQEIDSSFTVEFMRDYIEGDTFLNLDTGSFQNTEVGNNIKNFHDNEAKETKLSGFDSRLGGCTLNSMMCCFGRDRQPNDNNGNCANPLDQNCVDADPADNSNLCYTTHDSKFYASETEDDIHCHGLAWAEESGDFTNQLKFNNLFYVSLYDHMYQRGYVENVVDVDEVPMCACMEDMNMTVSRSDCTQIDATLTFIIKYDADNDYELSAIPGDDLEIEFNSCEGINPGNGNAQGNDLASYAYRLYLEGKISDETKTKIFSTLVGYANPGDNENEEACIDSYEAADFDVSVERYEFPPTGTSQFVHGICVHSDKGMTALATDNDLQYVAIENVASGALVWGDRTYTLAGVEDSPCAGATYLQPSRHKEIDRNTVITVAAILEGDPTAEICMFVEEGRGRDGGFSDSLREYDGRIVDHGADTGLAWRGLGNDHPFRVFCRTVPDQN